MKLNFFAIVLVGVIAGVVECCPYHDRLRELAALQNQRLQQAQSENEVQRINSYFDEQRELLRQQWKGRIDFGDEEDDHHEEEHITGSSNGGSSHGGSSHGGSSHGGSSRGGSSHGGSSHSSSSHGQIQEEYEYVPAPQQEDTVACPNTEYYVCPAGTTCVFEYGRYRCRYPTKLTCHDGYRRVNISSTQFQCLDINECDDEELNTCTEICRNTVGSFRCDCHPGYQIGEDGTCEDINECELGYTRCQHECLNTAGSWTCTCPEGYTYDDYRCQDINECGDDDLNTCTEDQKCLNTFGGHQCLDPPVCDEGYARAEGSSAFGPCIVQNFTAAFRNNDPVSITSHKFSLFNGYPAHTNVANLSFRKYLNHRYYFTVLSGNKYFSAYRPPGRNILMIRTLQQIVGPQEITMQILATDINYNTMSYNYNRRTRTRIDITFVVSEFDF